MPRTKSLQHYPDRYQEIIRECGLEGKQIEVLLEDYKQALKLRGHWYAFIGSLKAEVSRIQRGGQPPTPGEEDLIQLAGLSASVMVTISEGPLISLTFQSREHSWQAKALAGATVRTIEGKPTATGLDSAAMRLLAIQAEAQGRMVVCPTCGDVLEPDQINSHEPCFSIAQHKGGSLMARTVDLGWAMARCDGIELEIMEPESEDSPAKSFRITGLDVVRDLRDFLSEAISDAEHRIELESKGFDNGSAIE